MRRRNHPARSIPHFDVLREAAGCDSRISMMILGLHMLVCASILQRTRMLAVCCVRAFSAEEGVQFTRINKAASQTRFQSVSSSSHSRF